MGKRVKKTINLGLQASSQEGTSCLYAHYKIYLDQSKQRIIEKIIKNLNLI